MMFWRLDHYLFQTAWILQTIEHNQGWTIMTRCDFKTLLLARLKDKIWVHWVQSSLVIKPQARSVELGSEQLPPWSLVGADGYSACGWVGTLDGNQKSQGQPTGWRYKTTVNNGTFRHLQTINRWMPDFWTINSSCFLNKFEMSCYK